MIDHQIIKDLIDSIFIASRNKPMTTTDLRKEINKIRPEITTTQVWQTLNDPRFVGHYIRIQESTSKRDLYQIEENCFLILSKASSRENNSTKDEMN